MTTAPDIPRIRLTTAGLDLFDFAETAGRTISAPPPQNPCGSPAEPPPEALRIRDVLSTRIGRHQALTAPHIAQAAGLWPDLRDADRGTRVRELIAAWYEAMLLPAHVLVATSAGYFHTGDAEDLTHQDCSLDSRIREIALRRRRIRMAARLAGFVYHGKGKWEGRCAAS